MNYIDFTLLRVLLPEISGNLELTINYGDIKLGILQIDDEDMDVQIYEKIDWKYGYNDIVFYLILTKVFAYL